MAGTSVSVQRPIEIEAGVQPITDWTASATSHYVYSKAIRFVLGMPEKIGGWLLQTFDYGLEIMGSVRSIFTEFISGKFYVMLGSNEKLYALIGSRLTNITPLETSSNAVANSLSTQYGLLSAGPFASSLGNPYLIVLGDTQAARFQAGDEITISGATGFAGIAAGAINGVKIIRSTFGGGYTIYTGTNANASSFGGGGAAVLRRSGLINVIDAAHGQSNGDRVKISGAVNTGGVLAAEINAEHIIRNVATNDFDIMTTGFATSAVTAAGGGATVYYQEIPIGLVNESAAQGYGAGLYGLGLYGTALVSTTTRSYPRIWFMDRYGNTIIATPGNQGGLYQWFGDTDTAPALITNAPTTINYAFVSNGIIITFGATDENSIETSDLNNPTVWTSSSTNQVFIDDVEGAGRLISHCPTKDNNLIFTESQTYTFRYIGIPLIWEIQQLDSTIGIIAPMARVGVKGIAFWMSQENFHLYRGGRVEIIPANSQPECTALRYVFDNLNWGQKSKIFAWYNPKYDEVWFHYPSAGSNEPDRVIRVELKTFTWSIDEMDRTAAEWPSVKTQNPYLANETLLYKHELGYDDNDIALPFQLTGPKKYQGKEIVLVNGVIPDSTQTGDITFTATGFRYPQSTGETANNDRVISPTTEFVTTPGGARFWQYDWQGEELGQYWQMGQWLDEAQKGPKQ